MKEYQVVLFDLDGTLTDSAKGITNSVAYSLNKQGIEIGNREQLLRFVGPPLVASFQKYYHMTEAEAEQSVVYFREYFRETGIFENEVYSGVKEMLEQLKKDGKTLILATSKPEEFAKRIMHRFELEKYFDGIAGATMDSSRVKKTDVIVYALERYGISDKSQVIMVGDRREDILGAKACGIPAIGVLYGYGDEEELTEAGALRLAARPEEVSKMLVSSMV